MSLTFNTKVFKLDRTLPDTNTYAGPTKTLSVVDKIDFKRVMPKPTSTFVGVARPSLKRTRSSVVNAISGARLPAIIEVSGSLPVGMTDADIDDLLADTVAALTSADGKALFKGLFLPTS